MARTFNGTTDKITVPAGAGIDNLQAFTAWAWVKVSSLNAAGNQFALSKSGVARVPLQLITAAPSVLQWRIFVGRSTTSTTYVTATDSSTLWALDTWTFVASQYNAAASLGTRGKFWIGTTPANLASVATGITQNGGVEGVGAITDDTSGPLVIGARSSDSIRNWNGDLGKVGYTGALLTLAQLQDIMRDTIPTGASAPAGYWLLGETGTPTTAADASGNGRAGTYTGTTAAATEPPALAAPVEGTVALVGVGTLAAANTFDAPSPLASAPGMLSPSLRFPPSPGGSVSDQADREQVAGVYRGVLAVEPAGIDAGMNPRMSALAMLSPSLRFAPAPGGTVADQADREQFAGVYSGVLATGIGPVLGTASLRGTGTLAASSSAAYRAVASLVGTATLTATGSTSNAAVASLVAASLLAADAHASYSAVATLTAAGTLAAAIGERYFATATLIATGTLAATATVTHADSAALTASGSLTAAGSASYAETATLVGGGTLAANGIAVEQLAGSAALVGVGTLAVAGSGGASYSALASLAGTATLAATGTVTYSAPATLTAAGTLAASGTVVEVASSALTSSGTLVGDGRASYSAVAALAASGTLLSAGTPAHAGTATLAGDGFLVASGTPSDAGTATLEAVGTLAASGVAVYEASGSLEGGTALLVASPGPPSYGAVAALVAIPRLVASGFAITDNWPDPRHATIEEA